METTIFNDLLSDYLERDEITEKQNSFRKKNVHNSKEILKEYLNRKDSFGLAPLHIASHNGQTEIIKLLISHGANPYLTTDDGLSVIHLAAEGDSVNVIHYFVKNYNINIDARDDRESTPLHWAVFEGGEVASTYLIAWGADINAKDSDGHTPLHLSIDFAEKKEDSRLVKILLLKGADRNGKNNDGQSPSDIVSDTKIKGELLNILSTPCFMSGCMIKMPLQ